MCGILAALDVDLDPARFERALTDLAHRGPDHAGIWSSADGRFRLGHRRLSIVDPSAAGHQPLVGEKDAALLVCNGEIYNAPELRRRLIARGHRFRSRSDNEVVLHAYEEWGERCVEELEGMFAFAVWDAAQRRLLAARDRVGVKPLYWARAGAGLLLASELGPLLRLVPEPAEPDPAAAAWVMTLGYVPAPASMWRGIHKLEAGHRLAWRPGGEVELRRYWEPPREIDAGAAAEDEARAWEALAAGVLREHLQADVPIGLFLSGGLDSSAVAAGLRAIGRPVTALTVGFPGRADDESALAAETAAHLGFEHRRLALRPDDVSALATRVAAAFDEPQSYSALLSMYRIGAAASRELKVVLSGDGGDEVFGGYAWYRDLDARRALPPRWSGRALSRCLRRHGSPRLRRLAARAFAARSPLHRHAWRLHPRFLPEEAGALWAPTELRFGEDAMLEPLRRHFEPGLPLRRALQRVDLLTFCSDSVLAKVDRASMAHALEVRVPWLDRRVIEWGLRRPFSQAEPPKAVLRRYLEGRVPERVLAQPKRGFSLRVLDGFDFARAEREIAEGPWVTGGHWSPDWRALLRPGVPYREARVWNLWTLTLWARVWLARAREGRA